MKILLTGASGFIGWCFCKNYAAKHEIIGTHFRHLPTDLKEKVNWQKINLIDTKEVKKLVQKFQPEMVLHLAAIANASFCEKHPALSHHINVYTTVALAEVCKEMAIPLVFSSTDLVFNGENAPYDPHDLTYPLSQYGIQKQTAEDILLNDFENTLIVRLPLQFGFPPSYGKNFFSDSIEKMQQGESINAFCDEKRTPLSGNVTSQFLNRMIDMYELCQKERILNLGSKTSISRHDFMLQVARVFELDSTLIHKVQQADLELTTPRPADVSLAIDKTIELIDFEPPSLLEMLESEKKIYNS